MKKKTIARLDKDIHGRALLDYYQGKGQGPLMINNEYGPPEEMPLDVYFRNFEDFSALEEFALSMVKGKVLEVGAGAGALSLYLQQIGKEVTALEYSPGCLKVMHQRGLQNVIGENIFTYNKSKYDTILLLMNGIGLAGTLKNLEVLLDVLVQLLTEDGQIIFDSSDVSYLELPSSLSYNYYGEIQYQYEYNGQKGDWFSWLYIDQETLQEICQKKGLHLQIVFEDDTGQYLARIRQ